VYRGKTALITGGLGFIGSNLALRLAAEGARVLIIDSLVTGCGGQLLNLEPSVNSFEVIQADIGDAGQCASALGRAEVIFNLAGEISHVHSMRFPVRDLELNTLAQLRFLEAAARLAPGIRVVYAGTRQVYGVPEYLPVDEAHPVNPVDFNGVHKYAATMYHLMLQRMGLLDTVVLRLTNVYGPRMALYTPCQGFLSAYLRKLLTGQRLEVYGDGRQLRDPLYVDEAVDALLLAGAAPSLLSRSYNVGGPEPLSLGEIASVSSRLAGAPEPFYRDFPAERKAIDIGSYYTDSTRIRTELGWSASVRFEEGFRRTLDFYKDNFDRYLDADKPNPGCELEELPRSLAAAGPAPA
jgi:UDP-glucose 4-epimerase